MPRPPAAMIPIPRQFADLPNPRQFPAVALPPFTLTPDCSRTLPPAAPESWPTGEPFDQTITLSDGTPLFAQCCLPTGIAQPPLLVALHMWGMDHGSWERRAPGFLASLTEMGWAWCAFDFRWHGRSGGEPHCAVYDDWRAARTLSGAARVAAMADLAERGPALGANVQFLPDLVELLHWWRLSDRIDPARVALIGGSVGANCAWVASSFLPIRGTVSISPFYPTPGFTLMGREVDAFAPRDVLFISDPTEVAEAELMAARTGGVVEVRSVGERREHGLGLLRDLPTQTRVRTWLRERLADTPIPESPVQ